MIIARGSELNNKSIFSSAESAFLTRNNKIAPECGVEVNLNGLVINHIMYWLISDTITPLDKLLINRRLCN